VKETAAKPDAKVAVKPDTKKDEKTDTTAEKPEKSAEKKEKAATQPVPGGKGKEAAKTAAQEASPKPETATPPAAATANKEEAAAPTTEKPTETDRPAILSQSTGKPQLEYVKFDGASSKGETVMFKLNGFHPPAVHGVEEGSIPRVICDFNNAKLLQAIKGPIKANGQFVKTIRVSTIKKPEKIRVMIDLEPNRNYDLQQVFFKDDNLFVLFVDAVKK
jgi:hypothetical protein